MKNSQQYIIFEKSGLTAALLRLEAYGRVWQKINELGTIDLILIGYVVNLL
jgi:hypothetical protein